MVTNDIVMDKHISITWIVSWLISLGAGVFYIATFTTSVDDKFVQYDNLTKALVARLDKLDDQAMINTKLLIQLQATLK